jgi:hypothetical protein
MTALVVVSSSAELALAVGTRVESVGVLPEDLDRYLAGDPQVTAALVDVGGGAAEMREIVAAFRGRHLTIPIVVVGDPGILDESYRTANAPLAVLSRPFTVETVVAEMSSLGFRPSGRSRETEQAVTEPAADLSVTSSDRRKGRARLPRRRQGRLSHDTADSTSRRLDDSINALLVSDELHSVTDVSTAAVDLIGEVIPDALARHGARRRQLDRSPRAAACAPSSIEACSNDSHWLGLNGWRCRRQPSWSSGTDLVRQDLRGVPLIHLNQWMATTVAGVSAIVVLARAGEIAYTLDDAMAVRDLTAGMAADLGRAIALRDLARRLDRFRD